HRAREILAYALAIDGDLALARPDPYAGDGVLAAPGRVGAAQRVALRLALRRVALLLRDGGGDGEVAEVGERAGLFGLGHAQTLEFLRFSAATSSVTGCWPACGCSGPL